VGGLLKRKIIKRHGNRGRDSAEVGDRPHNLKATSRTQPAHRPFTGKKKQDPPLIRNARACTVLPK